MLKNNLKIAFRHLKHSKTATLINVFGLALGLSAAFFIWQYIQMENSYDRFHAKADRIYRLPLKFFRQGVAVEEDAMNVAPAGPAFKEEYPEVEAFVRFSPEYGRTVFRFEQQQFEEEKIYYTDSTLFDVFDFPLLEGDAATCLNRPFTIILTKTVAERYFGPRQNWVESPVGKSIRINNRNDYEVTAVIEDVPENSHIKFNALISFITFPITNGNPEQQWGWNDFYTFLLLSEKTNIDAFAAKIPDFNERHFQEKQEGFFSQTRLQPLTDIHLQSHLSYEAEANGDARTIFFLFLIGIAVVVVAWINYINLSTAKAEQRATEVGVRKVIGADKRSLISQFLTEAMLVNFLAIAMAVGIVQLGQPAMNALVDKQLPSFLSSSLSWWILPGLLLFGTLLSGLYPAFFLATFSPAKMLKGEKQRKGKGLLRKGLVTFQYGVSVILIIGTMVIYLQLDYMKNQDLGFALEQQLVINAPAALETDSIFAERYESFKHDLLKYPEIEKVGGSSAIPGKKYLDLDVHGGIRLQSAGNEKRASFTSFFMDEGFIEVFDLNLLAGRNFSEVRKKDYGSIIINESALSLFELDKAEDAIGKMVDYQGDPKQIIGVVSDYHHKSLQLAYEPTIFRNYDSQFLYFSLKLSTGSSGATRALVDKVQQSWERFFGGNPFNFFFLDDHFNDQYLAEQRLGNIIAIFSSLAILIACLGLFGLASYMVTIRTKEIGIRKVLGATTTGLVSLLSKDFLFLVLLAMLIASPLAWWLMDAWLENFAYRINIQWWVFALAGLISVGIAFITVSLQSVKAALANPVEALRSE